MANKTYLDLAGLSIYDTLLKEYIAQGFSTKEASEQAQQQLKDYVDSAVAEAITIEKMGAQGGNE